MTAIKHGGDLRALMKGSRPAAQLWLPWFHFSGALPHGGRVSQICPPTPPSAPTNWARTVFVGALLTVHSSSQSSPVGLEFSWKLSGRTQQNKKTHSGQCIFKQMFGFTEFNMQCFQLVLSLGLYHSGCCSALIHFSCLQFWR